jgi:hypothetical protein
MDIQSCLRFGEKEFVVSMLRECAALVYLLKSNKYMTAQISPYRKIVLLRRTRGRKTETDSMPHKGGEKQTQSSSTSGDQASEW